MDTDVKGEEVPMEMEDAIPTEGDVPPVEAPHKTEAADDAGDEEESGEEEDDDDDDLQVVLNTEAIEKNEVLPQSSQFQSRTNYFRSPMVIQPGTKYSRTATATRQPMQHTQQIQSFVTPSNSALSLVSTVGHSSKQKQAFELDIDSMPDKPWRKPGADRSDYFNYGFTEDSWRAYCQRQATMRAEAQMQNKIGATGDDTASAGGTPNRPSLPGPGSVAPGYPSPMMAASQPSPHNGAPMMGHPSPAHHAAPPPLAMPRQAVSPQIPPHVQQGRPLRTPQAPPAALYAPPPTTNAAQARRNLHREQDDSVIQVLAGGDAVDGSGAGDAAVPTNKSESSHLSTSRPRSNSRDRSSGRDRDGRPSDRDHRDRDRDRDRDRSDRDRDRGGDRDRDRDRRDRGDRDHRGDRDDGRNRDAKRKRSRSRSKERIDENPKRRKD